MVRRQLRRRGIADERVLAAMASVPRELFVAERLEGRAYADSALPIGDGQTISQPWVVAAICQALALKGTERVLEIGTGSGYSTAMAAGGPRTGRRTRRSPCTRPRRRRRRACSRSSRRAAGW